MKCVYLPLSDFSCQKTGKSQWINVHEVMADDTNDISEDTVCGTQEEEHSTELQQQPSTHTEVKSTSSPKDQSSKSTVVPLHWLAVKSTLSLIVSTQVSPRIYWHIINNVKTDQQLQNLDSLKTAARDLKIWRYKSNRNILSLQSDWRYKAEETHLFSINEYSIHVLINALTQVKLNLVHT